MIIIPAIDIVEGKCVRLAQGEFSKKTIYNNDPLEVAKGFEGFGLKRLHLVDLDGAREGRLINYKTLEKIAAKTNLIIDFGGGIKTEKDLYISFESGAAMASIGSVAVKDKKLFLTWIERFGTEKFLLGADVKNEKVCINGWQETSDIWITDFLKEYTELGIKNIFCTDVSKDGMLQGPAIELYEKIKSELEIDLIASGGVSGMNDIESLQKIGCSGVIVGKALYEGKIKVKDIQYLFHN